MRTRNRALWVLERENRVTYDQWIAGALYDFVDGYKVEMSDGRMRPLLACIREETGSDDRTLRRIFRGMNDSLDRFGKIYRAIWAWVPTKDYVRMKTELAEAEIEYFESHEREASPPAPLL